MSIIASEEWLYRSVCVPNHYKPPVHHYKTASGNLLELSCTVFNDAERKPSCDRKFLLASKDKAKRYESDGVVQIQVKEVEALSGKPLEDEKSGRKHFALFDPTENRPAHSKIITEPAFSLKGNPEKRRWKAFQELLAIVSARHGWVIEPKE